MDSSSHRARATERLIFPRAFPRRASSRGERTGRYRTPSRRPSAGRRERMLVSLEESNRRWQEAERARRNRSEILRVWSRGQVTRRDLIKMGLFTAGGALVARSGLSPYARSAYAVVP